MVARSLVFDLPYPHVRVVDRHRAFCHRFEVEIEDFTCDEEHRLAELIQLQILFDLVRIEVVFGSTHFFGIETVVPGLDHDICAFGIRNGLHISDFLCNTCNGRGPDCLQQSHGTFRGLRHAVLQTPLRVVVIAQQLDTLVTQLQDFLDELVIVELIAIVAPTVVIPPDPFSQDAIVRIGQEWIHG